ncbi:MAG: glycosyltransferase 87 family protein, partial [Gemmataceae bacterium]|nr:glycosyltransferase 87 family protein [Gemmataceae bacterium]
RACLLLNLGAMAFVVARSAELARVPWPVAAWLAFFFLPFYHAVAAGQFALPVFACLLVACDRSSRWAGAALALALVKPSLALPFLVVPMTQRRWSVLLAAAAVQGALLVGLSVWLGASPVSLVSDWLAVAGHFMVSFFGVQYPLLRLGWVGTPLGTACTLAALAGLMAAARFARERAFAFLCLGCLLWTYHLGYDFVAQFPVVLLVGSALGWTLAGFTGTLLLVAVSNLAYFPPAAWTGTTSDRISDAAWLLAYLSHPVLLAWLWRFPVAAEPPSCDNR